MKMSTKYLLAIVAAILVNLFSFFATGEYDAMLAILTVYAVIGFGLCLLRYDDYFEEQKKRDKNEEKE